jgi:hypothetical protein
MVVIENTPWPESLIGEIDTFDALRPKVRMAEPPTKCLFMYKGSFPMSLDVADKCTWVKCGQKICLVRTQFDVFFQLTFGLMATNVEAPKSLKFVIILCISKPLSWSLKSCWVFCAQIQRTRVWSMAGIEVPKGCKCAVNAWRGWDGDIGLCMSLAFCVVLGIKGRCMVHCLIELCFGQNVWSLFVSIHAFFTCT